jgi:hypothetical protein
MNRSLLKATVIFALALPACNAREEPPAQSQSESTQAAPGSAAADPSVVHHPEPPERPATKRDSIQLEGSFHPITATLVKPQASIPFSTYVPEDMLFEQNSSDEGEGFYFYTNFGGQKNENAFMLVFLLPAGRTRADAQALADAFVSSRKSARQVATAQLGEYNGRYLYVARTYPAEFGDGMGPRTHYIRSQWVWLNDGRSLDSILESRSE